MKAMARQRSHSIEFKRQVAQDFIAGESLYALSKRDDISRQLIRVWVQKYEAGLIHCNDRSLFDHLIGTGVVLPNKILGSCHAPQDIAHQDMRLWAYHSSLAGSRGDHERRDSTGPADICVRTATSGRSESSRVTLGVVILVVGMERGKDR
jgi:hypothetical protein